MNKFSENGFCPVTQLSLWAGPPILQKIIKIIITKNVPGLTCLKGLWHQKGLVRGCQNLFY